MLTIPMDKATDEITKSVITAARDAVYTPEQVEEMQRILNAQYTYFWCCDMNYWDVAVDLFTEKLTCIYNGEKHFVDNPKAEAEFLASSCIPLLRPMHMSHNPIVIFTGEKTARVLTKLNSHHTYSDNDETYQAWGQYINDFEKGDDGRWRISVLRLTFAKRIGAFRPTEK